MKRPFILLIAVLTLLGAGCAHKGVRYDDPGFQGLLREQPKYYIIGKEDLLTVTIFEKWPYSPDTYKQECTVREDGSILIPPIGKINIENLTVREAEEIIVKMLDAFFKRPYCQIEVKEYKSHKVCVLGDIVKVKVVGIKPGIRVLEVLTESWGRVDRTYLGPVKLVRRVDNVVQVFDIDLKRIILQGQAQENVLMADGDIVFVPRHPMDDVQRYLTLFTSWIPTYFMVRTLGTDLNNLTTEQP